MYFRGGELTRFFVVSSRKGTRPSSLIQSTNVKLTFLLSSTAPQNVRSSTGKNTAKKSAKALYSTRPGSPRGSKRKGSLSS